MTWNAQAVLACLAVCAYVGVHHLILFAKRPQNRENLFFGLLCLAMAGYDGFAWRIYQIHDWREAPFLQRSEFTLITVSAFLVFWFVHDLLHLRRRRLLAASGLVYGVLALLTALTPLGLHDDRPAVKSVAWLGITYHEVETNWVADLMQGLTLVLMGYIYFLLWRAHRRGTRRLVPILAAMAFFFAAAVNDIAVATGLVANLYLVEYGFLAMVLAMAYPLSERYADVLTAVERETAALLERSRELSHAAADSTRSAAEQAAAAAEVATTLEELRQTSSAAAAAAAEVLRGATESADLGRSGAEATAETRRVLAGIGQVAEVVDLVDGLAVQSNLLAVNASIEASKAGEAGRRFGVVAAEVRRLAAQSRSSAQRIREAVARAEDGRQTLAQVEQIVGRLAAALVDSADRARQIAAGASQQAAGIRQMADGMGLLADGGRRAEELARRLEAAVRDLEATAGDLGRHTRG